MVSLEIRLYTDVGDINIDEHDVFPTKKMFYDFINNDLAEGIKTLSTGSYRYNGNVLEISLSEFTQSRSYIRKYTYCSVKVTEEALVDYTFYHVDSISFQSGMVRFNLIPDTWANYMDEAQITEARILGSNRNFGNGMYKNIGQTKDTVIRTTFESSRNYDYDNDLHIVFTVMRSKNSSTIFGRNFSTYVDTFSTSCGALYESLLSASTTEAAKWNFIDYAIHVISSITSWTAQDSALNQDCQVLSAYIVPKSCLRWINYQYNTNDYVNNVTFVTKGVLYNTTFVAHRVEPSVITKSYNYQLYPFRKVYIGTQFNGMELQSFVDSHQYDYEFTYNQNGLIVLLKQGANTFDLTSSFQVNLTTNEANYSGTEGLKKVLANGLQTAQLATSAASGNYIGAALGVGNLLASNLPQSQPKFIQGGDALVTYRHGIAFNDPKKYNWPFGYYGYLADYEDWEALNEYGVIYDKYSTLINGHLTKTLQVPHLTNIGTNKATYIQANVEITGVPLSVKQFFEQKFATGVKIWGSVE